MLRMGGRVPGMRHGRRHPAAGHQGMLAQFVPAVRGSSTSPITPRAPTPTSRPQRNSPAPAAVATDHDVPHSGVRGGCTADRRRADGRLRAGEHVRRRKTRRSSDSRFQESAARRGRRPRFRAPPTDSGSRGVDDDTAIVAAFIAQRLKLTGNPTHAAEAARDKHQQRQRSRCRRSDPTVRAAPADGRFRGDRQDYPVSVRVEATQVIGVAGRHSGGQSAGIHQGARPTPSDSGPTGGCRLWRAGVALSGRGVHPVTRSHSRGLSSIAGLHVLAIFDKPDPLDGPFFERQSMSRPSTVPGRTASVHQRLRRTRRPRARHHRGPGARRAALQRERTVADRARRAPDRRSLFSRAAVRGSEGLARGDHPAHALGWRFLLCNASDRRPAS